MNERIRELMDKRAAAIAESRGILDKAKQEKRELSPEENDLYDKAFKRQDDLKKQIEREERQVEIDRELNETDYRTRQVEGEKSKGKELSVEDRQMLGFRGFLMEGRNYDGDGSKEFRALQADGGAEGGFLLAPQKFVETLIKGVDDMVFIRQWATKFSVTGEDSLGAPSLDNDPDDFNWTSELATGSEDNAMSLGKRELKPHPLAKRIKVSNKLIRKTMAEQVVMARFMYKLSLTQEKAYLTGSGAGQPLGLFTASADGIPTSRDISTDNTATAFTIDGLKNAKYSLKMQYHAKAKWLFHREGVKRLSKLKDGAGQYLWQPSVREGVPDSFDGVPVFASENCPSTFTANQYVGMIGDFSHYWIVDDLNFALQRLVELYSETNQTGFIGRYEGDGMPVLPEAFARVQLGA